MKVLAALFPEVARPADLGRRPRPRAWPPHGAASLAGALRGGGHEAAIEDFRLIGPEVEEYLHAIGEPATLRSLEEALVSGREYPAGGRLLERMWRDIEGREFDVLALCVSYHLALPMALLLARTAKARRRATVVLGGSLTTARAPADSVVRMSELMGRFPCIDYTIVGQGETPLTMLADALGREDAPKGIPNLLYRDGPRVAFTRSTDFPIDEDPLPDFTGLSLDRYVRGVLLRYPGEAARLFSVPHLPYRLYRGCSQRCAFCTDPVGEPRLQMKSHDKVLREIACLKERHGLDHFFFLTFMVNIAKGYLETLCGRLAREGPAIRWSSTAGIMRMKDDDGSLAKLMAESGCYALTWGMESGSDRMLRRMDKQFTIEQAERTLRQAYEAGIRNNVNFIAGFPGENEEDVEQTLAFISRNARFIALGRVFTFSLREGSPVFMDPARFGVANVRPEELPFGMRRFRFDERDGLPWEGKLERMIESTRRIRAAIEEAGCAVSGDRVASAA